ncbi:gliding motility-associated C-terminal domain-containing protein [Flavobacterium humidisoli]|uniref:Gliding motility-associated C-terminal domain-containing protein n=1 Tax=Flavobacterium humidisoli TaxID=2937442 RepID=A0ABY4M215_9FLAO|nr:gliding motility-associated C-terminal domain-containing protein [Flavobacterium humidisoli]UPZ17891.1 gliding motility-associated C-terminal domain-containing protein [Flavobacterium humidisoli]
MFINLINNTTDQLNILKQPGNATITIAGTVYNLSWDSISKRFFYDSSLPGYPPLADGLTVTTNFYNGCNTLTRTSTVSMDNSFMNVGVSTVYDPLSCSFKYQLQVLGDRDVTSSGIIDRDIYFCNKNTLVFERKVSTNPDVWQVLTGSEVTPVGVYPADNPLNVTNELTSFVASANTLWIVSQVGVYRITASDNCHSASRIFTVATGSPLDSFKVDQGTSVLEGTSSIRIRQTNADFSNPITMKIYRADGQTNLSINPLNPLSMAGSYNIKFPIVRTVASARFGLTLISDLPLGNYKVEISDGCTPVTGLTRIIDVTLDKAASYSPVYNVFSGCSNSNAIDYNLNPINTGLAATPVVRLFKDNGFGSLGALVATSSTSGTSSAAAGSFQNLPTGDFVLQFSNVKADELVSPADHYSAATGKVGYAQYTHPIKIDPHEDLTLSASTSFCDVSNLNSGIISVQAGGSFYYPLSFSLYSFSNPSVPLQGPFAVNSPVLGYDFINVPVGDYFVKAEDKCVSYNQNVTVSSVTTSPVAKALNETVCPRSPSTLVGLNAGSDLYTITWTDDSGQIVGTGSPLTVFPTATTNYTASFSLNSSLGCAQTAPLTSSVKIKVTADPILSLIVEDIELCTSSSPAINILNTQPEFSYEVLDSNGNSFSPAIISSGNGGKLTIPLSGTIPLIKGMYFKVKVTNGNAGCSGILTDVAAVVDTTAPVAPVLADLTGECPVTPIAPTAQDACAGTITGTTGTAFPITAQGTTAVVWIFDDGNGNTSTAIQNVTVKDTQAPVAPVLSDLTGECSVTPIAPTAQDACAGTITGTTATAFPITAQGTTVVSWIFDDGRGNTSTAIQNVTVKDTQAPVAPVLSDLTGECPVTPIAPTAQDACAGTITGTTATAFPITAQGTTVVSWIFDDGRGNTSTAIQNVTVKDTQAPVAPVLSDLTGECSVTPIAPTAQDACAGTITGTTGAAFPITAQGTTVVSWIFDDGRGNTSTAIQNVTVKDTQAPVAPVLSDLTGECSVTPIAPTAQDACAGTITGTTATAFPITAQGTTVVSWIFDDGRGNTSTAIQNVTVKDTQAPVAPVLSDLTGECSVTPIAPTAQDACAGTITGTTGAAFPITAQGTTVVSWIFDDGRGNTSTAIQNVTVKDTQAPIAPVLADLTGECSVTPIAPTAQDACAGTITGTTATAFPITAQGTTVVSWIFDDGRGNTSTAIQNVTVKDTQAPVAPVLSDLTGECPVTPIAPTAQDACAGTITGTTGTAFPITAQGTTVVSWIFDDGRGNTSTAIQNVTVKDTQAPVAPVLSDLTGECSVTPIAPTAQDACAGTITGTTATAFPITAQGTTAVVWIFDDGRGNTSTAIQNVTVKDTQAPVAPVLSDLTGECSVTPIAPTAQDACAGTITGTTATAFPITAQGTTVVSWIFDDGRGNTSTAIQNVTVKDTQAPIAPVLADLTGECSVTPIAPTAQDACAGTITGTTGAAFPITAQGTTVVSWIFDDGRGNTSTAIQNVTVKDTQAPVAPVLSDLTGECPVTPIAPTAQDACAGTITGTTGTAFPITAQGTTVVSWIFDDGRGNTSTAIQNVTVKDTQAPVAPVLSDLTGECPVTPIAPTAQDACAGTITGTTATAFPITAQGTTAVVWIFDDGRGNTSTAIQNVTVKDTQAPVAPVLSDLTGECSVTPIAPTAQDACAGTITGTTDTAFPITAQGTTVVSWIFDDGNGNIRTVNQNVLLNKIHQVGETLTDCSPDGLGYKVVVTFSGIGVFNISGNGGAGIWKDNVWTSDIIAAGIDYDINFEEANGCSNFNLHGIAPFCCTLNVKSPPSAVVNCTDSLLPSSTGEPIIESSCGMVNVIFIDGQISGGCSANTGSFTREFFITDANGNTKTTKQLITVEDMQAPVFIGDLPHDISVDCDKVPEPVDLSAKDDCSDVNISYSETKEEGERNCYYTLVRTWKASDLCGNVSSFTQKINVSCYVNVFNGLSLNGDNKNEVFYLEGIECYPNNTVEIFNRSGNRVYHADGYDNVKKVFKGISEGTGTISGGNMLPTGTYFYILKYDYKKEGENESRQIEKTGYLYILK